jgi:hypothetical protein
MRRVDLWRPHWCGGFGKPRESRNLLERTGEADIGPETDANGVVMCAQNDRDQARFLHRRDTCRVRSFTWNDETTFN